MDLFTARRLSCGILILNPQRELLLCHVTGQDHWDLPKGGMHAGETPAAGGAARDARGDRAAARPPRCWSSAAWTTGRGRICTCSPR